MKSFLFCFLICMALVSCDIQEPEYPANGTILSDVVRIEKSNYYDNYAHIVGPFEYEGREHVYVDYTAFISGILSATRGSTPCKICYYRIKCYSCGVGCKGQICESGFECHTTYNCPGDTQKVY